MNTFKGRQAYREQQQHQHQQRALRDGLRAVRRSISDELMGNDSPSRDSEPGGGPLNPTSDDEWSPTSAACPRAVSDDGHRMSASSPTFMVGSSVDDDVFTEASSERQESVGQPSEPAQVEVYRGNSPQKVDAQGIYPGTACMFVANLAQHYDDETLEYEVTRAFSRFGQVWVKIKRDSNQMPFAFCQFTNEEHAKIAKNSGKDIYILGRPARTEMARAACKRFDMATPGDVECVALTNTASFIIHKHSGEPISLTEATQAVGVLSEVAKAEYLNAQAQAMLNLPPSAVITYKMFDGRRNPERFFADHETYRVVANDPKRLVSGNTAISASTGHPSKETIARNEKDSRSVYLGNLPLSMDHDILNGLAGGYGQVETCEIFKKPIPNGSGERHCFGFVEFARPEDVENIIEKLKGAMIHGYNIRVERKHSRSFESPRHPIGPIRHVHSTITRPPVRTFASDRDMAGSSAPPNAIEDGREHPQTFGPSSISRGRGRRPRPSVLDLDTSIGNTLSKVALDDKASAEDLSSSKAKHDAITSSPLRQSVNFYGETTESHASPVACDQGISHFNPHTPSAKPTAEYQDEPAATETTGEDSCATEQVAVPQMAWMPTYTPYPYGYMGTPMTPQGAAAAGMMYGGYMASPFYSPVMYDMFGNMVMSPTSMMSPFTPGAMAPVAMSGTGNDAEASSSAPEQRKET